MTAAQLSVTIRIPDKRKPGGQSERMRSRAESQLRDFADDLKRIQSGLDFHMGARDWCYALEPSGLLKGDFDRAADLITDARKAGLLQPGFILEDKKRDFERRYDFDMNSQDYFDSQVAEYESAADTFRESPQYFNAVSIWKESGYFVQVAVEKAGLESLFSDLSEEYQVNLLNMGGFTSLESLATLARLYHMAERKGCIPVLLVCTDHDPVGLFFANNIATRFEELKLFTGWNPENLIIDRFGLDYDFIEDNRLTWIDNLESGTGNNLADTRSKYWKDNSHGIQDYVSQYGIRKCEANAIMVDPELGRTLLESALLKYLGGGEFESSCDPFRIGRGRSRLEEIDEEKENRRNAVNEMIAAYFEKES